MDAAGVITPVSLVPGVVQSTPLARLLNLGHGPHKIVQLVSAVVAVLVQSVLPLPLLPLVPSYQRVHRLEPVQSIHAISTLIVNLVWTSARAGIVLENASLAQTSDQTTAHVT